MTSYKSQQIQPIKHNIHNQTAKPLTACVSLPRGKLQLTYRTNSDYQLDDLLNFAQRINPKRAFLFVSKVLGRHIPVAPSVMRQAFTQLANLIPDDLPSPILVVGMAETAVGLSAGVHQVLQTRYPHAILLNSTRHTQTAGKLFTTFSEDHSHASAHLIYQSDDATIQQQLINCKTLVMVDDEASTGNTCVNVVNALSSAGLSKLEQVHLATLVDWSLTLNGNKNDNDIGARLGNIEFYRHHLLAGTWQWKDAVNPQPITMPSVNTTDAGTQPLLTTGNWGRQPTLDSTQGFAHYLVQFKHVYCAKFDISDWENRPLPPKILVLGSNEFVWVPFLLAEWLESQSKRQTSNKDQPTSNQTVNFSALTRSPIAVGGAIKTMLSFHDNYGLGMTNFVYNVDPNDWDLIVLCIETPSTSVDSVWHQLSNVLIVSPKK